MRLVASIATALLIVACGGKQTAQKTPTQTGTKRVIIVSIDGLMPDAYMNPDKHGLKVPTLRWLRANGAYSPGVQSVFPTVTYPSHTSIATGTNPGTHGIVTNYQFDPLLKNKKGWRWYAEAIKVPTLWQVARAAGMSTALIDWPVTVGAQVDALVPEFWRAGTKDDQALIRALSTPGLLDAVAKRFPKFWERYVPPDVLDEAAFDIAVHLLATRPPQLMMVHGWMVDEWQHRKGIWSAEAKQAIEVADTQLRRLIDAAKVAGVWKDTLLMVVSDHGFMNISKLMRPGVLIAQAGLITADADGKLTDWKASVTTGGGQAYFYIKDSSDEATKRTLLAKLAELTRPGKGIRRIYTAAEIRQRGGDPRAFAAIDAEAGWAFGSGYSGDLVSKPSSAATHGFDPERPEMRASLLIYGASVRGHRIDGARLIDVAPTAAKWLQVVIKQAVGKNLLSR